MNGIGLFKAFLAAQALCLLAHLFEVFPVKASNLAVVSNDNTNREATGKSWQRIDESKYVFLAEGQVIGMLDILVNSKDRKAFVTIGENVFTIKGVGFWKDSIEIIDGSDRTVLKTYPENWYGRSSVLKFNNDSYTLLIRNNPLSEFAILDGDCDLLAYGLNLESKLGRLGIKISGSVNSSDYLLDFLLWYLFVPVAVDNMGIDFRFLN
nr:hypothetical protein [Cytophagales bacterium]